MVMGSKRFWCSRGDRTPGLVQCIVFVLSPPHLVLAGVMRPCFGGRYSARRPPWLVIRVPGAHILGVVLMSTSANDRSHFVRPHLICSVAPPAPPLESHRGKGIFGPGLLPGAILRGGGGYDRANEMRAYEMGTVICGRRH